MAIEDVSQLLVVVRTGVLNVESLKLIVLKLLVGMHKTTTITELKCSKTLDEGFAG
jgi:hypothetical protein